MTLKKSSRAGLLALALGIMLGLFLSVASFDASYAQAQAPAAAQQGGELGRREHASSDVSKATPGIDMHRMIRQAYTNGAG
jgi:hypothetical protein